MDRLWMENYLLILKSTVEVYVHGTLESSNEDIRITLKKGLDSTMNSQNKTFQIMAQKKWYDISNVEKSTITKKLEQIYKQNEKHQN